MEVSVKTIETKVFEYDELDDRAKDRARDWYSNGMEVELDYVLDAAVTAGELLGISLKPKDIHYEVGYGQGCSAGFSGVYEYRGDAGERIRAEFPGDTDLHLMADQLDNLQEKHEEHLSASIYCTRHRNLSVTSDSEPAIEDLESIFADFAHWIYSRLQIELEYQYSEEVVEESIRANEYTFTETGQRWG